MKQFVEMAEGSINRVVAVRLKPGADVMEGLIYVCEQNGIKNGVILSCIGSLKKAIFMNPIEIDSKAGYGYGDPTILEGPIELTNATGIICHGEDGEILPHVHMDMSDREGNGYGGHLAEGTKVLLTVDFVIGEIDGIIMGRGYDEELGVPLFKPRQK